MPKCLTFNCMLDTTGFSQKVDKSTHCLCWTLDLFSTTLCVVLLVFSNICIYIKILYIKYAVWGFYQIEKLYPELNNQVHHEPLQLQNNI